MDSDPHELGRSHPVRHPAVTGYRLLTVFLTLTFGLSKAALAYKGQSVTPTTLEWVFGVVIGIGLYWLGAYEADSPESIPWLFQIDYWITLPRALNQPKLRLLKFAIFVIADIAFATLIIRIQPPVFRWQRDAVRDPEVSDFVGSVRIISAFLVQMASIIGFGMAVMPLVVIVISRSLVFV
ncbi:hypothetical protein BD410DRAFT_843033 [Rickenella mellea]|uniref:Uncharacterized protein n=1 Tax=Rickenella mellea TaxID=50990 RepID=A0A4Y7PUD2_9AGAM|nr:hypothetical protein BD410DRAFT_843033 [Rickenella mellea]